MTREPMVVHYGDCSHEWAMAFLPCSIPMIVKLMRAAMCPMCASKKVLNGAVPRETPDGDAIGWLTNGDTGTSSVTIWHVMMDRDQAEWDVSIPRDPDDFGRCYRLLKVMPSWRERLHEVAVRWPKWKRLIAAWDEVEALYLEELPSGRAPKCYALMEKLGC